MTHCKNCLTKPTVTINGNSLCSEHAYQWQEVESRHAPNTSGPIPAEIRRLGGTHKGVKSHTPRHYK
jgi:hypothetical protein